MSSLTKDSAVTRSKWFKPVASAVIAVLALLALVLVAKWLRNMPEVQDWIMKYPGQSTLPETAPTGLPAWMGWQHFLNMFFIVLIIRSGWLVRTTARPKAYWTRNNTGLVKTKNKPNKISLDLWFHLTMDALWIFNGIIFIVMLFATGHWMRIVPTSWDIIPNAASAALQYASLNWPLDNGWVNYNALQMLAYGTTVFVAAPLAIVTGLRMSGAWPKKAARLNKLYPVEVARAVHFPVMIYFVVFVILHVTLVLATGAKTNLNHMYAASDADSWTGFWVFAVSIAITVAAWFLATPLFLRPVASLTGKVSR